MPGASLFLFAFQKIFPCQGGGGGGSLVVSTLRHEEIPKRIKFMMCGVVLLRSPHSCRIVCSLFHILSPVVNWNRCLVSSFRCPHPIGQLGLGRTPLFSVTIHVVNYLFLGMYGH